MAVANPSLTWQQLSDVYYSILPCYELPEWPLEDVYSHYRVSVSQNCTLLAVASRFIPHPNVVTVYALSGTKIWTLVYNSTGAQNHITGFAFNGENLCVALANGRFRVYTDFAGTFDEYSYVADAVEMKSVAGVGKKNGPADFKYVITNLEDELTERVRVVVETVVWGQYLVLRHLDSVTFVDLDTHTSYEVPFPSLYAQEIHAVCLVAASAKHVSFIMSYGTTVYSVHCDFHKHTYEFVDEQLTDGPFTTMAPSANGQLLALLNTQNSRVFVTTTRFDAMLLEYDTSNESSAPYMVAWTGNDAIVLSLRDEIKLVGPGQKLVSFFYDIADHDGILDFDRAGSTSSTGVTGVGATSYTIPLISTAPDGLWIVTRNRVEFLSRVSPLLVHIYLVGLAHPASILLDCVDKLTQQASKADSNIALLTAEGLLVDAVDGCLAAAIDEFLPPHQKAIMKAASFGKIYTTAYNADKYVRVLNTLKVLNQLRSLDVGIFLTNAQLVALGWPAVISMLLRRLRHLLALRVTELIDLPDCRPAIYIHWCCCKIRAERAAPDIDLFRIVAKKLLSALPEEIGVSVRNHIPTHDIFEVAHQEGRLDLCKLLINIEPSPELRIIQLLHIDEVDLALLKCFQTCEYDLCVLLLRHLKRTLSVAEFQRVLSQTELVEVLATGSVSELLNDDVLKPYFQESLFISGALISNVWKQSTAKHDPKLLEEFYRNTNNTTSLNLLQVHEYMQQKPDFNENSNQNESSEFADFYHAQRKELAHLAQNRKLKLMVQAEIDTLELQYKLSTTFQQSFFAEKSVVDILKKLIKLHQLKLASKVVRDFKISPEKFWYLVLESYCKSKDFDRLNKFIIDANSNSTVTYKSPIGFEEIVDTCLAYNCPRHYVSTYIPHCSESTYTQKAKLYIRNGDMMLAADEAFNNKDAELLRVVQQGLSPADADVLDAIKSYLNRLGA